MVYHMPMKKNYLMGQKIKKFYILIFIYPIILELANMSL